MKKSLQSLLIGVFLISAATARERHIDIVAAQPTHYYFLPMAKVNPANDLVVSLHELSYGLPGNLQLEASLFDNIGRVDFGAKFGLQDNLAIGLGLAHTLLHMGSGVHGIGSGESRLGAYLSYCFTENSTFEAVVSPHLQLFGASNSFGCDIGGMVKPSDVWSVIWEVGTSYDVAGQFYFNVDGGLRIHPPSIPFLSFDFGLDVQDFAVNVDHPKTSPAIYFDVIFAMKAR
jgi:hypothetical protein